MSGGWPYSLPYGLPNQLDCSCNCLLLLQKMETENLLHCNFSSFSFKVKHLIPSAINVLFLLFSFQKCLLSTNFVESTGNWLVSNNFHKPDHSKIYFELKPCSHSEMVILYSHIAAQICPNS